jgi:hypothetical protein
MEDLIKISKTFTDYYKQLNPEDLTEENFKLWIESLQEPMRTAFNKKGLRLCKGVLNFQRFILELNDLGLDEFLKENLTPEEYSFYMDSKN